MTEIEQLLDRVAEQARNTPDVPPWSDFPIRTGAARASEPDGLLVGR